MASTIALYVIATIALTISFMKDKKNTKIALKKAWKSFENILPQFLSILILIGIILAIMTPEQISHIIGKESGWMGVILASIVGAITLVPGFIAFPLAAALIKSGAGYMQIAAFISTLMMVGVVTIPLEMKFLGKKAAIIRNIEAYIFSLIVALIMGVFL
ncbi:MULTISPECIES: permease [unclassified Sedimentibacter]|uniref:permease n=1 Tax=unclassified Sedimentibacter TaxID=2649220 RepID=UPI0027E03303|nr:permease [Sedimentibacter sp. MB35-C1]WMJ76915.1 permease [Sedimentibacter sp. MB35-C1]